MQKGLSQEFINQEMLQFVQDEFCRVAGLYAYCLNVRGEIITEISGTGAGVFESLSRDELRSLQMSPYTQRALERVEEGSLEDTAVECFPGGRLAAVSVCPKGRRLLYWVMFDCSERDETVFTQAADLVRDVCTVLYDHKVSCHEARKEAERSLEKQQQMSRNLQRMEAVSRMIQLLDEDTSMELTVNTWLEILGQQLQVENLTLFCMNQEMTLMNVLAHWHREEGVSPKEDCGEALEVLTMLRVDKPQVYSTGGVPGEHQWEANHYGLSAVMIFPILRQKDGKNVVLLADYREESHNWEAAEIKFTADGVKILKSILTRTEV